MGRIYSMKDTTALNGQAYGGGHFGACMLRGVFGLLFYPLLCHWLEVKEGRKEALRSGLARKDRGAVLEFIASTTRPLLI
jgi:hypothetical protein